MIALYCCWNEPDIDPADARRFAGSLGAGLSRPVGYESDNGLLFAALCTTPVEARVWQAARTPGGERVLFTGYFDHPDAMADEFGVGGADAATLYAAGYARWGDAVDLRMLGQFATVVVPPDKAWVRCTRSPLFAPPLHIRHDANCVAVASVARTLFAVGDVIPEVDEQKIADSLYLNYADRDGGWYRGVTRIGAGTRSIVTPRGREGRRYYDIAALPRIRLTRDEDYVAAANQLFLEGTRAALAGFRNPAVSLSGGLDSQAVAVCALEVLGEGRSLPAFTGVPEAAWHGADDAQSFGDESGHVAALAALYPALDTERVDAAGLSFGHLLPAMFLLAGAPPRNTMNLHWIHAVRARAEARGCDVLLIGQMGNHGFSFSGAGALPAWFARGRWLRLWREVRAMPDERSLLRRFLSHVMMPLLPDGLFRRIARWRSARHAAAMPVWCPMRADYAAAMHVEERAQAMGHDTAFRSPRSTAAYRHAAFHIAMNEGGDVRQALDAIHGIATRDPTAYRPLVEFCLGIPDDQYLRGGRSRWLARRMLQGRLPELVLSETRRGRQAADWALRIARERDALIAELDALADDPEMAARLDIPRLRRALEASGEGSADSAALQFALPRAIATARFIRFVEGTNRA